LKFIQSFDKKFQNFRCFVSIDLFFLLPNNIKNILNIFILFHADKLCRTNNMNYE